MFLNWLRNAGENIGSYIGPHKVISGPTSHLNISVFFFGNQSGKKMAYKQQNALQRGQDYKMQTIVYPRSQAWMVKPLSAGCVNTVVAG